MLYGHHKLYFSCGWGGGGEEGSGWVINNNNIVGQLSK